MRYPKKWIRQWKQSAEIEGTRRWRLWVRAMWIVDPF